MTTGVIHLASRNPNDPTYTPQAILRPFDQSHKVVEFLTEKPCPVITHQNILLYQSSPITYTAKLSVRPVYLDNSPPIAELPCRYFANSSEMIESLVAGGLIPENWYDAFDIGTPFDDVLACAADPKSLETALRLADELSKYIPHPIRTTNVEVFHVHNATRYAQREGLYDHVNYSEVLPPVHSRSLSYWRWLDGYIADTFSEDTDAFKQQVGRIARIVCSIWDTGHFVAGVVSGAVLKARKEGKALNIALAGLNHRRDTLCLKAGYLSLPWSDDAEKLVSIG